MGVTISHSEQEWDLVANIVNHYFFWTYLGWFTKLQKARNSTQAKMFRFWYEPLRVINIWVWKRACILPFGCLQHHLSTKKRSPEKKHRIQKTQNTSKVLFVDFHWQTFLLLLQLFISVQDNWLRNFNQKLSTKQKLNFQKRGSASIVC